MAIRTILSEGAFASEIRKQINDNFLELFGNFVGLLSTTTGIDAKVVANTALYAVPTGKTAIITGAVIRCTAATAITVGPSLGLGNAAGSNNIFASTALTLLTGTTNIFGFTLVGMSQTVTSGNTVYLNLGTASSGTSQIIACDLKGYLI